MKPIIYTVLTNGYDALYQPQAVDSDCRYVLFTDKPVEKPGVWEVREMPACDLNHLKASRQPKILSHRLFPDAEWTIYVDGNLELRQWQPAAMLAEFQKCHGRHELYLFCNPATPRIQDEVKLIRLNRPETDLAMVEQQMRDYLGEGMPASPWGQQCGFLIRRHTPAIRHLNEIWWDQVNAYTHRDQPGFGYARWKSQADVVLIALQQRVLYARYHPHQTKRNQPVPA